MTVSFAEELVPHLDKVLMQSDSGGRLLKSVHSFFDKYTMIAQRFTNDLHEAASMERAALERMPRPDRMNSCWEAWLQFFTLMSTTARSNGLFVDAILANCVKPLDTFAKESQAESQKCHQQVDSMMEQIKNYNIVISAERDRVQKSLDELSKANEKRVKAYGRKVNRSAMCIQAYKSRLRNANVKMRKLRRQVIPGLLSDTQKQETARLQALRTVLGHFSKHQNIFGLSVKSLSTEFNKLSTAIQPAQDIQMFISYCTQSRTTLSPSFSFLRDFSYDIDTPNVLRATSGQGDAAASTGAIVPLSAAVHLKSFKGTKHNASSSKLGMKHADADSLRKNSLVEASFRPCQLFGSTIAQVMEYQRQEDPSLKLDYPMILRCLVNAIKDTGGTKLEGIFRISAAVEEIQKLRDELESGNYSVTCHSPHVPANVLKCWLRELESPLIPNDFYMECMRVGKEESEDFVKPCVALSTIFKKLPKINLRSIQILLEVLQAVVQDESINKMTDRAIAVVFAPSFFRSGDGTQSSYDIIKEAKIAEKFVVMLLRHHSIDPTLIETDFSFIPVRKAHKKVSSISRNRNSPSKSREGRLLSESEEHKRGSGEPNEDEPHASRLWWLECVREEIIETEQNYLQSLQQVCQYYVESINAYVGMRAYGITPADGQALTNSLETLKNFHMNFLSDLELANAKDIPSIFIKYAEFFRMYITYLNGYEKCVHTINKLKKQNKKFQTLFDRMKNKLQSEGGLDLFSYLIMPVQRIPRYVLLLRELKKQSDDEHLETTENALARMSEIAAQINERQKELENRNQVMQLQENLKGFKGVLVSPHRRVLKEGKILVLDPKDKNSVRCNMRMVYLLNDFVIVASENGKTFKSKLALSACSLEMHEDSASHDFALSDSKATIVCRIDNTTERETWLTALKSEMEKVKAQRKEKMQRRRQLKPRGDGPTVHNKIMAHLSIHNRDSGDMTHRMSGSGRVLLERTKSQQRTLSRTGTFRNSESVSREVADELMVQVHV